MADTSKRGDFVRLQKLFETEVRMFQASPMAHFFDDPPVPAGSMTVGPRDYSDHFPIRYAVACRQLRTRDPWAEDRFSSDPED